MIFMHWKDLSYILRQVREEATGRVYKVFNEKEDANEEEVSWCSTNILGRYQEDQEERILRICERITRRGSQGEDHLVVRR